MHDGLRSFAGGVLIWPYLRYDGLSLLHAFRSPCVTLSYLIRPFASGQTLGSIMLFDHQEQYCVSVFKMFILFYLVCVCVSVSVHLRVQEARRGCWFSPGRWSYRVVNHGDGTSQPLQVQQLFLAAEPSPAFSLPFMVLICISPVSSVAEHLSTHDFPGLCSSLNCLFVSSLIS